MKKVLEIFAGSRSIGKEAEKFNNIVFSIDWHPYEGINLIKDVEELNINDIPFIPDIIWASPDCKTYSISAISKHRKGIEPISDYAIKCDKVNTNLFNLINQYLKINNNLIFFIENPRGMFRKMPFVEGIPRKTIWYCQYGDNRAKPTDIFTNSKKWEPRKPCFNGNINCHHQPSPRGSKTGTQGKINSYERSKIPSQLCIEILKSAQ